MYLGYKPALKLACGYRGETISSSSQLNTKFWDEQFLLQCPGGDSVWCGGEMDELQFTSHCITLWGISFMGVEGKISF